MISDSGLYCTTENTQNPGKETLFFVWKPNGDWVLGGQYIPKGQENYGLSQIQITSRSQERRWNRKAAIADYFGGNVVHVIYARGNSIKPFRKEWEGQEGVEMHFAGSTILDTVRFNFHTLTELQNVPTWVNGDYNQVLLKIVDLRINGHYHPHGYFICEGDQFVSMHSQFIPIDSIFNNPNENTISRDYINRLHYYKDRKHGSR